MEKLGLHSGLPYAMYECCWLGGGATPAVPKRTTPQTGAMHVFFNAWLPSAILAPAVQISTPIPHPLVPLTSSTNRSAVAAGTLAGRRRRAENSSASCTVASGCGWGGQIVIGS